MSKRGENIYERKDGRWEARILGETGRYKYFYGKSYSEVKAKKNNWIKGNSQKKQCSETGLISDKLQKWLKECYGQVKNTTYESYYYCMAKHIIPYFKKNKVVKLTEIEANEFKMYIYNNTDLSQSYKHKILQVFKTALKNILDKNESTQVIINALKFPKSSKKYNIVEAFSVYEQRQIEKLLTKNKSNKDIGLLICFYTGLRLGELCALSWEDVDFDLKMLNIDKTLIRTRNFDEKEKKTRLICTSPKSRNSVRKIPFPDFLEDMLFRLFEKAKSKKSFILSNSAVPMDPRTIQRHHEKVLKAAGLEHRKFHVIRHTFATRALEIGIDITTLSDLLGHSSVSTTLNIYTHSLLEQKKLAISKMNALHTKKMKIVSSGYAVKKAVKK